MRLSEKRTETKRRESQSWIGQLLRWTLLGVVGQDLREPSKDSTESISKLLLQKTGRWGHLSTHFIQHWLSVAPAILTLCLFQTYLQHSWVRSGLLKKSWEKNLKDSAICTEMTTAAEIIDKLNKCGPGPKSICCRAYWTKSLRWLVLKEQCWISSSTLM